jgi:polyhydroxyalkanoate synthesis regulator phasin
MTTFLNTPVIYSDERLKVDTHNGIIRKVVVIQKGIAKGHNFKIDDDFLDTVVTLANEHTPGIKARFGHPNMCSTALGTYLGRFKNYRREGDKVLADLYLDPVSKKAPSGNLYEYVLDMALSNPDMFGASIAFKLGGFKDPSNSRVSEAANYQVSEAPEDTASDSPNYQEADSPKAPIIEYLYATDIVDNPAATDGLFSAFTMHQDMAAQVTMFLDEHPDIFELLEQHPEIIDEFFIKYKQYRSLKLTDMNFEQKFNELKQWITDTFQEKVPHSLSAEQQALFDELKNSFQERISLLETLNMDFENLSNEFNNVSDELNLVTKERDTLLEQVDKLTSEINKLKAEPSNPAAHNDPALNINKKQKENLVNLKEQMPEDIIIRFTADK